MKLWQAVNNLHIKDAQRRRSDALNGGEICTKEELQAVLDYYGNRCAYCSRSNVPLEIDHIIPVSKMGKSDPYNLAPSCKACNRAKHNDTLIEFMFFRSLGWRLPARGINKTIKPSKRKRKPSPPTASPLTLGIFLNR